jgi:transposase
MEERKGHRKHSREFKEEAVRLVVHGGRPAVEVAQGLGIHVNMLHKWIRRHKEDPASSFPGKGHLKPQDEEMRRLERENANLKEERDILKKALAIFSRHPK